MSHSAHDHDGTTTHSLLTDVQRNKVTAPLAHAWTLPPHAYTDPHVFEQERSTVMHGWVAVARSAQLAEPRCQLAVDVLGEPVLLTRRDEGQITAMANVCRHRAMPLVDGTATGTFVTCPYHLWSYDLDGQLRRAPLMGDDFDVTECSLPRFAVEEWQGFVFVSLGDDPPPLAHALEPLRALIEPYGLSDLVIAGTLEYDSPWNWKLLAENFMEAYHHIGPHRDTFQPEHPAGRSSVVDNGGGPWSLLRMPGADDDDAPSEPAEADGSLPFLPHLEPGRRSELLAGCVYPTLLFALSGTLGVWYEVVPHAHDRMTLRIHLLLPPEVATDPDRAATIAGTLEGLAWIHGEDIPVNEGPWQGLHSSGAEQGRLSPLEAAIWQFNQWWTATVDPVG